MRIGIAGPVSLEVLQDLFPVGTRFPKTYSFPLIGKLARSLVGLGHEVTVFAGSDVLTETKEWRGEGIRIVVCPRRIRRAPYDFFKLERRYLSQAMRSSDCEVIHAHWNYEFAAAALDSGKASLVTAHDSPLAILGYFIRTRYAPNWFFRALLGAATLHRSPVVTAVSPYLRDHIRGSLRLRGEIRVIPNGIDQTWLEQGEKRLREGVPSSPFTVVTVMDGFGGRKNSKNALRAFQMLRLKRPEARLTMYGNGHGPEEAGSWAIRNQLAEGVLFAGRRPQEEIAHFMLHHAHVLLHPSLEESFGMAPLEAMALGVPVIGGSDSGGVPYVVGEAGLLVDARSVESMAKALERLADSTELGRELGRQGWERAGSEFSMERMVRSYEQEYRRVLEV